MKKVTIFFIVFIFIHCIGLYAHENYIVITGIERIKPGKSVMVKIGSGHNFPDSESIINPELLSPIQVVSGNKIFPIVRKNLKRKKSWLYFYFTIPEPGTYIFSTGIKKRFLKHPLYYMKTILIAGKDTGKYTINRGLEIAPLYKLSNLKLNQRYKFQVLYNGKGIKSSIKVIHKGRERIWRTDRNGIAEIKIKSRGYYLLLSHYRRKRCSLSFYLK